MLAAKTSLKNVKSVITTGNRTFAAKGTTYAKFDWEDPMNLHGKLTDEEQMIWEVAKNFSQEKLQPRVMKAYDEESFDLDIMKEYGELGFLGCTIPDYGLPGLSSTGYGLINRAVEYVDSGYRSALSVQSSLVMFPIHAYGNQALKDRLIPDLATAKKIGCFGLTEPDAGSDPSGMKSKAVDMGSHYVLNGSKTWITNSPHAEVFVYWAKDEKGDILGFVLERS